MSDLEGGGAEKALISLLKEFDYTKYKVSLCLLFRHGVYLDEIPSQVNTIFLFKSERSFFFRKAWKQYLKYNKSGALSLFIRMRLRKHYDVIISYLEGHPVFWHNLILERGGKNISWIHSDMAKYHLSHNCFFYGESDEKQCYSKMDKIVFVSEEAMNNFKKLYDITTPRCFLYNIINSDTIYHLASLNTARQKVLTITAIGSLLEVKGYDRLIRVAKMLQEDGCSFCIQILGQGEREQELRRLACRLGVEAQIKFLGFQKNPYPYLHESDIFVSISHSEGLSLVICEALILGVPVVATRTAGALELLGEGKYGLIAEQNDFSIYVNIKKMIVSEPLRREYRIQGLLRASAFDVKKTMEHFYNIIEV